MKKYFILLIAPFFLYSSLFAQPSCPPDEIVMANESCEYIVPDFRDSTLMKWKQVESFNGSFVNAAIATDGTLWTWGSFSDLLGHGDDQFRDTPKQLGCANNWIKVSIGLDHVVALNSDGELYTWGSGSKLPTLVDGSWSDVEAGPVNNIAIGADGSLWEWGSNETTLTQINNDLDWEIIDRGTTHSCAITEDGDLYYWVRGGDLQYLSSDWIDVSIGNDFAIGIKTDGSLWEWQINADNSITNTPTQFSTVGNGFTSIEVFIDQAFAIRNGQLYSWGMDNDGEVGQGGASPTEPLQVGTQSGWTHISAGVSSTFGLIDNNIFYWGGGFSDTPIEISPAYRNNNTQFPPPSTVLTSGTHEIKTFGCNALDSCSFQITVECEENSNIINCPPDEVVMANNSCEYIVPDFRDSTLMKWRQVETKNVFTRAAIATDNTLWTWGARTGHGDFLFRSLPEQLGCNDNWKDISVGSSHILALNSNGELYSWGSNRNGELGLGDFIRRELPNLVSGNWTEIDAGTNKSIAINSDGALWEWGESNGTPRIVDDSLNWIILDEGIVLNYAITDNGDLYYWNPGGNVQFVGSDYIDIAVGDRYAVGIKNDGSLWNWQIFDNSPMDATFTTPVQIAGIGAGFSSVEATADQAFAIRNNQLYSWGMDETGEVGQGGASPTEPELIGADSDWTHISSGYANTLGLRDSCIYFWGDFEGNFSGEPNTPKEFPSVYRYTNTQIPISGTVLTTGIHDIKIKTIGCNPLDSCSFEITVECEAISSTIDCPPDEVVMANESCEYIVPDYRDSTLIKWKQVETFNTFLQTALATDNTLWTWGRTTGHGDNSFSVLPKQLGCNDNWVNVSVGLDHVLVLNSDGEMYSWGTNENGELGLNDLIDRDVPNLVTGSWIDMKASGQKSIAISTDQSLWEWGKSIVTPTLVDNSLSWEVISANGNLNYAITSNGDLYYWVPGGSLQFISSDWKGVASGYQNTVGLKTDGSLWDWQIAGSSITIPVQLSGAGVGFSTVYASGDQAFAIRSNQLYSWGMDSDGELGQNGASPPEPLLIGNEPDWTHISSGLNNTFGLRDSCIYFWGQTINGTSNTPEQYPSIYRFNNTQAPPPGTVLIAGAHDIEIKTIGCNPLDSCNFQITVECEEIETTSETCCPDLENLITNGNFELGPTAIRSDYSYQDNIAKDAILPGSYTVINTVEASTICEEWQVDDHTTYCDQEGNFLVVNGQVGQSTNSNIWEQTITNVDTSKTYALCAYFKNLQQCCFGINPTIYVLADGVRVDTITLNETMDGESMNDPCEWQSVNIPIDVTNSSVRLSLELDEMRLGDGNDLAMDDISFYQLVEQDIHISILDQRPNSPNITASVNLIDTADDTLAAANCTYEWTVAKVSDIDIIGNTYTLETSTIQSGATIEGWDLTTDFPGYNNDTPGLFDEGLYYIALKVENCECLETATEKKFVGWFPDWIKPEDKVDLSKFKMSESSKRR